MATNWRTPGVVILCGGLVVTLSMGIRHAFGLFLQPMSADFGWGREIFSLALALQNLVWGATQPFTGFIADRFGAGRVLVTGAMLYVLGLVLMASSSTGGALAGSAGLLIGLGLSGTTFSVVYGVIGRTVSPEKRSTALGIAGAAGSFGQFMMVPVGQTLIGSFGWMSALLVMASLGALMVPLSTALVEKRSGHADSGRRQTVGQAIGEAARHRGFWLLTLGFFVCGFQVVFIASHLPSYLADQGQPAQVGMLALALVGLFNIFGTYGAGVLGGRYTKKYLLSVLYTARAVVIAVFIAFPVTPLSSALFAAAIGLLWLSTVPLTNGIVAQVFGVQYLSMLSGFVFFSHQVGSFLGAWLGGYLFDATGSYRIVWILCIGLAAVAALINLPIDERPVSEPAGAEMRA
ncbi:MAG TPA: MFS transporter [Burkholderiales bacterium]|nr:MFS transporter [Burkholderiales bacterium]